MDNFLNLIYCKRINYISKENNTPISGNPNEDDQIYQNNKDKNFDEIISMIQTDNDENDPLKLKYNDLITYLYKNRKNIGFDKLKPINQDTIYKYNKNSEYDNKVNVYFNTLLEKYDVRIVGALDTALNYIKNTSYENIFKCFDIIVDKFNTIDSDETITKNNLNFLKNIFNDLHLTNQHLVDIDLPSDDSSIENAEYPFFKKNNSNFSQKNIEAYCDFSLKRISIIKEKIKKELIRKCNEEKEYNEKIKNDLEPLEEKINQININDYDTLSDLESALNEIYNSKDYTIKNKFQSKAYYDYDLYGFKDDYDAIKIQIDPLISKINKAINDKKSKFINTFETNIKNFNENSDFSYTKLIDINRIYLLSTGINIFIFSILDDKDISSDINVIITDKPFIENLESINIFNSYKIINSYIDKNLNYYESLVDEIVNKYYQTHKNILEKLNKIKTSTDEELLQESSFYFYLDKTITLDSDHIPKDHILSNKIVNIFTDTANSKKMFELLFNIFRKEE